MQDLRTWRLRNSSETAYCGAEESIWNHLIFPHGTGIGGNAILCCNTTNKARQKWNRCTWTLRDLGVYNIFWMKPRNLHWLDGGQLYTPSVPACLFSHSPLPTLPYLAAVSNFALPQIWIFITNIKLFQLQEKLKSGQRRWRINSRAFSSVPHLSGAYSWPCQAWRKSWGGKIKT
jgi:hypothetical protein